MTSKFSKILLISILFVICLQTFGQSEKYNDIHFQPPLNIPMFLSGTFGELRSNHFHAGIDIKTQGKEGQEVFAVEDGYVSRVKVSTSGYGKVLYITHSNGYVSVYGHLQKFNEKIQKYIKELQYSKERFLVEAFPEKGELLIRKGDVIALSGNTGGSNGPHLHFEIREETTQYPVNPLFFDSISIKDQLSPKIEELAIYPVNKQSLINGKNDTAYFSVIKKGTQYTLEPGDKITILGPFSLGIRTYDKMNDISNKNGIYSIELLLDTLAVFGLEMDKLSFATVRYINSLIDYHYYKLKKRRLIRTQVDTNNRIFNYREVSNNGIFSFSDSLTHRFKYIVSDAYDNESVFTFSIEATDQASVENNNSITQNIGTYFKYNHENQINKPSISLKFPANTFYRSFYFQMKVLPSDENSFAPLFQVHNKFTPVQKQFTISIIPDTIPQDLKSKMYVAYMNDDDEHFFIASKWKGNKLIAKSRLLGNYTVLSDTTRPVIKALNFYSGKNISKQPTLKASITDKQTGIKSYEGRLNGHWILMEYEPKKKQLTYEYDEYLLKGKNEFILTIKDLLDNETVYKALIIY